MSGSPARSDIFSSTWRQAVWAGHQRSPQLMRDDAILPATLSSDRTTAVDAVEELEETAKLFMIFRDAG